MLAYLAFSVISISGLLLFVAAPSGLLSIRRPRLVTVYIFFFILMSITLITAPLTTDWAYRPGFASLAVALPLHLAAMLAAFVGVYAALSQPGRPTPPWRYDDRIMVRLFVGGLIACSAIMVVQYATLPTNPIAYILSGSINSDLAMMMREEAFKLNSGPHMYVLHLNRMVLFPGLVALTVACRVQSKDSAWNKRIVVAAIAAAINGAASTATGVVVIVVLVAGFAYLKAGGRLTLPAILMGAAALFAAPVFFDAVFGGGLTLSVVQKAVAKAVARASSGPFDALLFYFDRFHETSSYLGGRTNRAFAGLIGEDYLDLQNYMFHQKYGVILARTLHGSYNAHFIGYWNADFGLWGVAGISAAVGAGIAVLERGFDAIPDNPAKIACYAACAIVLNKLMSAQPTAVFAGHGAVPSLIVAAGLAFWLDAQRRVNRRGEVRRLTPLTQRLRAHKESPVEE